MISSTHLSAEGEGRGEREEEGLGKRGREGRGREDGVYLINMKVKHANT